MFTPRLDLSETYSSNLALTGGVSRAGWISDVAPAIRIDINGPRIKGNADYRRDILRYAGAPALNRNLNTLASAITVDAVDHWLFVDMSANVLQRSISSFDAVATRVGSTPQNQAETTTITLSPYIKGRVADIASYLLRVTSIQSHSNQAALASTRVDSWSGTLKNASAGARVGWSLDGSASHVRNDVIGNRSDSRLRGALTVEAISNVHATLSTGYEDSDYLAGTSRHVATPGAGLDWTPSPSTHFAAVTEKRFFGTGHNFLITHRTGLTNWQYTDVRDATVLPVLLSGAGQGTVAQLLSDLLAASIPDPAARAEAVRNRLNQDNNALSQVPADGAQTSRVFIDRLRDASVAWIGRRDTTTLHLVRREQEAVGAISGITDSFTLSSKIAERGVNLSWLHRLTPTMTLNATAAWLRRDGSGASNPASSQKSQTVTLAYRLSPQTIASLSGRSTRFTSTITSSFREDAIVASLIYRF